MKQKRNNRFVGLSSLRASAVLSITLALAAPAVHAAALTWDADNVTAGAQDGAGTWTTSAGNWRNTTLSSDNVNWSSLDAATFGAGVDGSYAVGLTGAVVAPGGVTFNNGGYTLSGGTSLSLVNGVANAAIGVAAGKTATINSNLLYVNNAPATATSNLGSTLNLGGGISLTTKPQFAITGTGTVNITAGTYTSSVANWTAGTMSQSGGLVTFGAGNNTGLHLGRNGLYDQTYTSTGGTLSVDSNAANTGNFLALGRDMGNFTAKLVVKTAGIVTTGTLSGRSGQINLGSGNGNGSSVLDVQAGGTVTVGTGHTDNQIYFFNQGANASKSSTMTQSGGTVTTNGIQFGNLAATYDASASTKLALSGGSLYVGLRGISKGVNATTLATPVIELTGGTLGASDTWSSSLGMKLGASGVTIKAATEGDVSKDITLSGGLSDLTSLGKLTKTGDGTLNLNGANTYTGTTDIKGGTLKLGASGSLSSSTIIVGAGTTFDVSGVTGGFALASGQTLSGKGTVSGAMTVNGALNPGSSPGIMATGNQTWTNSGSYNWQMLDATGIAGTGYDQIQIGGTLDLSSLTSGGFDINLFSLASISPDVSGLASNFVNTLSQSWNILTTSSGITGFNAANFNLVTGGFTNDLAGGAWSITNTGSGNNLTLNFTAVPEPNVAALLGSLGVLALVRRRRN